MLAIFKDLHADLNLYSIIFGESVFNDAIGLVCYETVKGFGGGSLGKEAAGALVSFSVIFGGSILIGMVGALLVAFVQKR